jgi:hypothetical protein
MNGMVKRFACALCVVIAAGCDDGEAEVDAGTDAGEVETCGDAVECMPIPELPGGTRPAVEDVMCPTTGTPAPEEQMGTCCWRHSNAAQLDTPEMRLTYIDIVAPVGSELSSMVLGTVLNMNNQDESFNWLFRVEGAEADGPVTVTTGFGRRQADGTYQFSNGMAPDNASWCPVQIEANLAGEELTSGPSEGTIVIPIFAADNTTVQVELNLRQITVERATWGEDRSCVGWKSNRPFTYTPAGTLSGFIEVAASREGMIVVPPINTTVCAAIAGSLADATYCDMPQDCWDTRPDSICDATGCRANTCDTQVCDPNTDCNAWRLVAHFAAAGVDITNDVCP